VSIQDAAQAAREFLLATAVPCTNGVLTTVTEQLHEAVSDLANELGDGTIVNTPGWAGPPPAIPDTPEALSS
jgi:hypothetical protein